jgi:hypothetical protein
MAEEEFDRANMIGQFLGERQGATHQPRNPLP